LFRGSSAVLNSLLTILNERTFNNGRDVITTPIQSIVAATNSFPQEEALQAFCDRFLFRPTVDLLKAPVSKRLLDAWALGIKQRPLVESDLTYADLEKLQLEVDNVAPSEEFLDAFSQVFEMLASRGIVISDRRRVQILKFMRGWALVQGDDKIYPENLHDSLIHIVYQTKDDVAVIREVLEQVIPTAEKLIMDIKRAQSGILSEFHALQSNDARNLEDLNRLVSKLRKIHHDLQILEQKAGGILEGDSYRVTIKTRQDATKLCQELDNNLQKAAKAIGDYTK
jgi:MoxR-like ATPase